MLGGRAPSQSRGRPPGPAETRQAADGREPHHLIVVRGRYKYSVVCTTLMSSTSSDLTPGKEGATASVGLRRALFLESFERVEESRVHAQVLAVMC